MNWNPKKWTKKTVLTILGIILMVLIVLAVFLEFFLSAVVKQGIEKIGSQVTGVKINVESLSISPFRGIVTLKGMKIGNVQGYSNQEMLVLNHFHFDVDMGTLFSDKLRILSIQVKGIRVNFETNILQNNLTDLQKQINAKLEKDQNSKKQKPQPEKEAKAAAPQQNKEEKTAESKKLQIDSLEMNDIMVTMTVKGTSAGVPLPLPPISLQDMGTGPDGITAPGVLAMVLKRLATASIERIKQESGDVSKLLDKGTEQGVKALNKFFNK